MPKIHRLREKQPLSEGTVVAQRSWEWCKAHMGNLTLLPSRPGRTFSVRPDGEDPRPDLAPFRGTQYVVLELEQPQEGYRAGYYLCSITPQQLAEKLKEA